MRSSAPRMRSAVSIRAALSFARSVRISAISARACGGLRRSPRWPPERLELALRVSPSPRRLGRCRIGRARRASRRPAAGCRPLLRPGRRERDKAAASAEASSGRKEAGACVVIRSGFVSAAMIRMAGQDCQRPVELLDDEHPDELVRQGEGAEGQDEVGRLADAVVEAVGPPIRQARLPAAAVAPGAEAIREGLARRARRARRRRRGSPPRPCEEGRALLRPALAPPGGRGSPAIRSISKPAARRSDPRPRCARDSARQGPARGRSSAGRRRRGLRRIAGRPRQAEARPAAGRRPTSSRGCRSCGPRAGRCGSITSPASISTQSQAGRPSTRGVPSPSP